MKQINKSIITAVVLLMAMLTSCNKFLDVQPKTQIPEELLFNSEAGFKDALTGVYILAKHADAYGKALTFADIENIISGWDITTNSFEQQIGLFNYSDARVITRMNAIFSQQYKVIAHINAILGNIDSKKEVFRTKGMYELIKGECLSFRAYLHFDLMRLYGPSPVDPGKGNQLAYVTEYSNQLNAHIGFSEYKEKIFKDLSEGKQLLKSVDPILNFSMSELRYPGPTRRFNPADLFFAYRYLRMNYYASTALEARAHLWYGDKELALTAAREVIEAKNADGTDKFPLATSAVYASKNYPLTTEQIFGMYHYNLNDIFSNNFGNATYRKGTTANTITTRLYGNTGTDVRESSLWSVITLGNGSNNYVMRKYLPLAESSTDADTDYKQIPMLRTSEMYLIAAETAPFADGLTYFKQFRTIRNIGQLAAPADQAALYSEIIKEYRKEFYGEGQAYYAYKRINAPKSVILFCPTSATVNYIMPMPTVEVIK
ncbi:RagB/SusD family nutrient uptake outer membrane protein [Pseudoflavitalea sp. G-6-1-2]|uniref:RagB/SusD family nutrient uptake outer membrane protein n=1 Tax=Pseudoflavitalea sp. G-6-1-2 TaxID=2728841 RepID=UPI001469A93F|nr:RagB/SusD family nutrient uptake outer membrane protein [Pseudoflavitalea sp. G-6-1-2]NML21208.1 RagB/SusD family nutrient uptake outer membrane protein [Pseudoflavitalea sp. G-6-1-2]